MTSVFLRRQLGVVLLLLNTVTLISADLPTLARICTAENKRGWVSVSGFCHVLDFYGRGSTDLPLITSGEDALKALTDEETAIRLFGKSPFLKTESGIHYALFDDSSVGVEVGEAHRDQCLAVFAALGLPASTPIRLKTGTNSIADLIFDSLASFSLDQKELEWSAMAFAKYVPPQTAWTNRAGTRISFSTLVQKLLQVDLNSEKCAGTHVLEALIRIHAADRRDPFLDVGTRDRLNTHLKSTIAEIVRKQRADGSWGRSWCAAVDENSEVMSPFQISFLVTGHLAEILNELNPDLRPAPAVYERAAGWITNSIASAEIKANGFWVCPFTHAARGARDILRSR